jgi:hypothetical protein
MIGLDCGPGVVGSWDWYRVSYGYVFNAAAPIREIGIDYGDGNSYVTSDAGDAEKNAFWHRYESPGSYLVQAWITDSNGLSADASCHFTWEDSGRGGGWSPTGGDLDCADIGYEHYVEPGDPHGLDADGDGIACEGW